MEGRMEEMMESESAKLWLVQRFDDMIPQQTR
jgi:hypothetical protein